MTDTPDTGMDEAAFQAVLDAPDDGVATPDASPPETAGAEAAPRDDGRDALGRFVAQTPPDAPPVDVAKATPTDPASAPPPPTPPDAQAAKAPEDAAGPVETVEPFLVKFGNRTHDLFPGAVVTPKGVLIPTEQAQALHTISGRALKYEAERGAIREQELRARQAEQDWRAKSETFGPAINQLFDLAAMPDRTDQDVEAKMLAAYEFIANLGRERPLLEQREQLARERAELQLQRELARPDPDTQREHIVSSVVATAQEHLSAIQQHLSVLTAEDVSVLAQRVKDDPERYAYKVGQRMTDEEVEAGFRPGDLAFDGRVLFRDAQVIAQYRDRENKLRAQTEEAVKAAQRNAKTAAAAAPPPPASTPSSAGAPARPTKAAAAQPEDYEDWFQANIAAQLKAAVA